jgi:hypothetical protein
VDVDGHNITPLNLVDAQIEVEGATFLHLWLPLLASTSSMH